jgi:CheY-like chemotaxis protein
VISLQATGAKDQEVLTPTSLPVVLVVDDSPLDRRLTVAILEKYGEVQTRTASDGRAALRMIEEDRPAVVLTDLQRAMKSP